MIVEGLGTEAMARRLGVSNTTVRTIPNGLLTKLGVHSRLKAASFAVRYSVLTDPFGPKRARRTLADCDRSTGLAR